MDKNEFLSILENVDNSIKQKASQAWDSMQKMQSEHAERIKQLEAQLSGESKKKSELENVNNELVTKIQELQKGHETVGNEKLNLEQKIQVLMENQQRMSERLEASEREKHMAQIQNVRTQKVAELTTELNLNSGMTKHLINTLQTDLEFEDSLNEFKKAVQETKAQLVNSIQPVTPPVTSFGTSSGSITGVKMI